MGASGIPKLEGAKKSAKFSPLPTLCQPFANPLPTFSANPSPSPSFRGSERGWSRPFCSASCSYLLLYKGLRRHMYRNEVCTEDFLELRIFLRETIRNFPRIILNLHLWVQKDPSGKKKALKHKSFWGVTPPVTGASPDREARGQRFMCYPRNPRNINLFVRIPGPDREDRWPGRPDRVLCAKVLCAFSRAHTKEVMQPHAS